jgi:hypothetical protein
MEFAIAICSLCGQPTRLEDRRLSYDAGARHAACHAASMVAIEERREKQRLAEVAGTPRGQGRVDE